MRKTNHLEKVMGWIVGGIIVFGILCACLASLVHPLSDVTRTGLLNIALACAAALAGAMNVRPQTAQDTSQQVTIPSSDGTPPVTIQTSTGAPPVSPAVSPAPEPATPAETTP
jgi:hypothetical protein